MDLQWVEQKRKGSRETLERNLSRFLSRVREDTEAKVKIQIQRLSRNE